MHGMNFLIVVATGTISLLSAPSAAPMSLDVDAKLQSIVNPHKVAIATQDQLSYSTTASTVLASELLVKPTGDIDNNVPPSLDKAQLEKLKSFAQANNYTVQALTAKVAIGLLYYQEGEGVQQLQAYPILEEVATEYKDTVQGKLASIFIALLRYQTVPEETKSQILTPLIEAHLDALPFAREADQKNLPEIKALSQRIMFSRDGLLEPALLRSLIGLYTLSGNARKGVDIAKEMIEKYPGTYWEESARSTLRMYDKAREQGVDPATRIDIPDLSRFLRQE